MLLENLIAFLLHKATITCYDYFYEAKYTRVLDTDYYVCELTGNIFPYYVYVGEKTFYAANI